MRYWLDTEFIEDGITIDLMSIGIVAEDGREYYAESAECELSKAGDWVRENVISHLTGETKSRYQIGQDITAFVGEKPEFWGYYADYDWVVLCQLYGTMMALPKGWPMFCRDVKQLCVDIGNPELPKQTSTEHHALADARWTKEAWAFLQGRTASYGEQCRRAGEEAMREAAAKVLENGSFLHDKSPSAIWAKQVAALIRSLPLPSVAEAASPVAGWRPTAETIQRLVDEAIATCEPENADEQASATTRAILTRRFSKVMRLSAPSEEARAG